MHQKILLAAVSLLVLAVVLPSTASAADQFPQYVGKTPWEIWELKKICQEGATDSLCTPLPFLPADDDDLGISVLNSLALVIPVPPNTLVYPPYAGYIKPIWGDLAGMEGQKRLLGVGRSSFGVTWIHVDWYPTDFEYSPDTPPLSMGIRPCIQDELGSWWPTGGQYFAGGDVEFLKPFDRTSWGLPEDPFADAIYGSLDPLFLVTAPDICVTLRNGETGYFWGTDLLRDENGSIVYVLPHE